MIQDKSITVWFSCGAASATAAYLTLQKYGESNNIRIVNNPVKEEHLDNERFLLDMEDFLGVEIEKCTNPKYPGNSAYDVWERRKYMSGVVGAPCTLELKKNARLLWEKENSSDHIVLGFTVEESERHRRFSLTERNDIIPVLIDEGYTKQDCFDFINSIGVEPPAIYKLGFPNANCIGCVKASSPTYWNLVRERFPDTFEQRAIQSREIGSRLVRVKGQRLFLDELKVTDMGRPLKEYSFECGIFCEE